MLDRAVQCQILELLREHYPDSALPTRELKLDGTQAAANLRYLEEHGLCKSGVKFGGRGDISFNPPTITAAGLDFLEDDGGLSVILGVITVRLHADTMRDLIGAKIETSSMPRRGKVQASEAPRWPLRSWPREATTELVKIGLSIGVELCPSIGVGTMGRTIVRLRI